MKNDYQIEIPDFFLSKRKNETYSLIAKGMPINDWQTKEACLRVAERMKIKLDPKVWDVATGTFIIDSERPIIACD